MSTAIILFAHGSPVESANEAVRQVAHEAGEKAGFALAGVAFLEPYSPGLEETVAQMVGEGATRVLVVPYFLTMGLHLQRDLPRIVEDAARMHPGIEIRMTPPLDGHPGLAGIVLDRARAALEEWR